MRLKRKWTMFIHTKQPLITSFYIKKLPIFFRMSDDQRWSAIFCATGALGAQPNGRERVTSFLKVKKQLKFSNNSFIPSGIHFNLPAKTAPMRKKIFIGKFSLKDFFRIFFSIKAHEAISHQNSVFFSKTHGADLPIWKRLVCRGTRRFWKTIFSDRKNPVDSERSKIKTLWCRWKIRWEILAWPMAARGTMVTHFPRPLIGSSLKRPI